jgi:CDP-diacylglycerol--serine O-phosphatidyltransferase
MENLFQHFAADRNEPRKRRFKPVPLRLLIPNMITLLALCSGLSALRMALEEKFDFAVYLILASAVLDTMDGRIARLMKGTSKFGAELDSLADFVSFGAVPVMVMYLWGMKAAGPVAWIAVLVFAICGALRLARFNVQADDPNRPGWMVNFFTGVPIPAAAILVMLPIYLERTGLDKAYLPAWLTVVYSIVIALLMVSRIPVFSGKKFKTRVPREFVLPLFVIAIVLVALTFAFPWAMLSGGTILYSLTIPTGPWLARRMARQYEALQAAPPQPTTIPFEPKGQAS